MMLGLIIVCVVILIGVLCYQPKKVEPFMQYIIGGKYDEKKPFLWIYKSNKDKCDYLKLTLQSIVSNCRHSFNICVVNDGIIAKLIPNWKHKGLKNEYIVNRLAMSSLVRLYGGMVCPVSFLCFRDLYPLYEKGTRGNTLFVCEMVNRTITCRDYPLTPELQLFGCPAGCKMATKLVKELKRESKDISMDVEFTGQITKWIKGNPDIVIIDGTEIGTKQECGKPVLVDDLFDKNNLVLYPYTFGLYLPANEITYRTNFEWFNRIIKEQLIKLAPEYNIAHYIKMYNNNIL